MKKVYQLLATVALSVSALAAGAQNYVPTTPRPMHDSKTVIKGGNFNPSRIAATSNWTAVLNYDSADATYQPNTYYHNNGNVMNTKYSYPSDTTGSGSLAGYFQNYSCINQVSVAFDSLYDPYTFTAFYGKNLLAPLYVDSIYAYIAQINNSGHNDTLEIQLNSVSAGGYPTATKLKDTMIIGTSIGAGVDNQIAVISWGVHYKLASGYKFAVTMKYYDYTKIDTCWYIYGFGSLVTSCPNPNSTIALNTFYSKVWRSDTASKYFVANSFTVWNEYSTYGSLPDATGGLIFYDCNGDGNYQPGTDGVQYWQNINILAMVSADTTTGINELAAAGLTVGQNAPNPFNQNTQIKYNLTRSSDVVFTVHDLAGRELVRNNYTTVAPGQHIITMNANQFTPGVYFYTFNVNGAVVTKKMVITQ